MKALWVCYSVLTDFCEEFKIKKNYAAPWITGLLHQFKQIKDLEIGLCFPIYDRDRMKDGTFNFCKYYSFQCDNKHVDYSEGMVIRFKEILSDFKPDIIHIWGTEFPHSLAMAEACEDLCMLDRVIVNIQGLMSIYAMHFYADIPERFKKLKSGEYSTLEEDRDSFVQRGRWETRLLEKVRHVIGRTDWDKAYATQINLDVNYHFCNEILRGSFYKNIGKWNIAECERHSIFVSQGHYPLKGLHYLLQAMPLILNKFPDTRVYIAGFDPTQETEKGINPYGIYLKELICELGLTDRVIFLGQQSEEEMVERYLRANVSVLTSSIENSPNSICEAMLLGTPVVSSYVGGTSNLIQDKVSGFLYQHDAPYMLAYYVCQIFDDDELAMRLSANASGSMEKIIDGKANSIGTYEIYKNILKGKL